MIAINTAITLAKHYPIEVLLLDLDMQFGVVEDYLNVIGTYGLADAVTNVADLDDVSLGSLVTKHESGLHTIGFKRDNSAENFEKSQSMNKLIPVLGSDILMLSSICHEDLIEFFRQSYLPQLKYF